MTQLLMFANSPTTKRAAMVAIEPDRKRRRGKVLCFLASQGTHGATDEEIQTGLAMTGDSERPRRLELQRAGLVRDSGRVRNTAAGRAACVWQITEKGRLAIPKVPTTNT